MKLKLKFRVLEYLSLTSFVWALYLIWLIPFMLFWVQIEMDEFWNWLITGTIFEMIFSYPIIKTVAKYTPRITLYWQGLSDQHGK